METACLRIKFTPLVQKYQKNSCSKCCLEIVPEVACIQNLDKLTWRHETNFIEYTIPMTYKVILKKRQAIKHTSEKVIKTYHSCVDLLISSSKSTLNFGSCNVSKIISDTFIFSKSKANGTSKEILMDRHIPSNMIRDCPISHKTTNTSFQLFDYESKEAEENIEEQKVKVKTDAQQNIESVILDKTSLDKITNTESFYPISTDTVQRENAVPAKTSSKPESRQKLSLSPICSLSTQETPLWQKSVSSKAITCKIYDSQKDLVLLGTISTPSDLSYENRTSYALSTIIDVSEQSGSKKLKSKCRVPPEIRVAEYMQYIEKEILPLKIVLNEIIFFVDMKNQQAVVEQIVQSLAFEVEAIPKDKTIQATSVSKSTPLNVKIRVRKKDEIHTQHVASPVTDEQAVTLRKIRLVNSDQTIMAFDVFMEAEFEKKPLRKSRKHIFDILKPGICLGPTDDDDYPYMPSSLYSANITESSVTTRSDGVSKQKFTLLKNAAFQGYNVATKSEGQKWLFGKCKPGGCLDPPFSEDKYSYKPSPSCDNEQIALKPNVLNNEKLNNADVKSDVKNNGRHSSIFDSGLFKKKRKCNDKTTNTNSLDTEVKKTYSVISIYQIESQESTHSNSIITYPPEISSDLRIDDKPVRSRGPSEEKSRRSLNDHSKPYFIPPKKFNRSIEKDPLYQIDYSKRRSSDLSDCKIKPRRPSKIPDPVPITIFIPIPVAVVSDQCQPKNAASNSDIIKTQVEDSKISEDKFVPEEGFIENINLKDNEIALAVEPATKDIYHNPIEFFKFSTVDPCNDNSFKQKPIHLDSEEVKIREKKLPLNDKDTVEKSWPKRAENLSIDTEAGSNLIPIPVPIPLTKPDCATITQIDEFNEPKSGITTSEMKIYKPEQLIEIKTIIENIKHTPSDSPKPMMQDIASGVKMGEIDSNLMPLSTNSKHIEINCNEITPLPSINCLYTQSKPCNGVSDTTDKENILVKQAMQDEMRRECMAEKNIDKLPLPKIPYDIKYEDGKIMKQDTIPENEFEKISDSNNFTNAVIYENIVEQILVHNDSSDRVSQCLSSVLKTADPVINNSKTASSMTDNKNVNDNEDKKSPQNFDCARTLSENIDELTKYCSGLEDERNNLSDKTSPLYFDKEIVGECTKPQRIKSNKDNINTFGGDLILENNGSINFITAPVIIDKTEQTSQLGQLKQVYSETYLLDELGVTVTGFKESQACEIFETKLASSIRPDNDDTVTQSTVSHELISNKTVIYDVDDHLPFTLTDKHTERIASSDKRVVLCADTGTDNSEVISNTSRISRENKCLKNELNDLSNKKKIRCPSVLSSTNTLKGALKKDIISVELAFQSYMNDKNERILKTFNTAHEPRRFPNDSVTVIKSQIRSYSNEIRIHIDSDHDISIQITKPNTRQLISIAESGIKNTIANGTTKQQQQRKAAVQTSGGEMKPSETKEHHNIIESDISEINVIDLYEQELVPLQLIIKSLRDEIDVLAAQQLLFRDKIFCPRNSKLPRLIHSNKRCVGCLKK